MWSDNETAIDSLNVQHLVDAVLKLLDMEHLSPVTIGVYGDWGSGKSSVALMLQRKIAEGERNNTTLCVSFNSWRFEGYEDAKTALMATILEAITDRKTLSSEVIDEAKKLLRSVDLLRVAKTVGRFAAHAGIAAATGGASIPASIAAEAVVEAGKLKSDTVADDVSAYFKETADGKIVHDTVRGFEHEFAEIIKKTKLKRVAVVVDDLDRCNPTQIIETLEAIRLFLAVPRTAFVITADEKMIQNAARLRFPGMDALPELGREYLEKMVQVPVRVPPLGPRDLETYLNMLFLQLHLSADDFAAACGRLLERAKSDLQFRVTAENAHEIIGSPLSEPMRLDLAQASQVRGVVALSVDGNPRQIKRYMNAVRLRLIIATARGVTLDPRIAAKLMLLEYFRLEAFRTLARWQATHEGKALELAAIESDRKRTPDLGTGVVAGAPRATAGGKGKGQRTATADAPVAATPAAAADGDDAVAAETIALPPEAAMWSADEWLRAWLDAEPLLGAVDLAPYMYFARDRLSARSVATQRMSPAAREILELLLSVSKAVRDSGALRAKESSSTDAVALLEALAERVRASDNTEEASTPFQGMLALVGTRPELITEFLASLRSMPVTRISAGTPNRLLALAKTMLPAASDLIRALITEWKGQSDNGSLAIAARVALESLK